MESDLPTNMDKASFLAWAETRERRYELVDGAVAAIGPNTRAHSLITGNIAYGLDTALDRKNWYVLMSFGVETGPGTIRDPDILVDHAGRGTDVLANAPALLAEVLSPSSSTVDFGDKPLEYTRLPSLHAYFVASQDVPKVWLWLRRDTNRVGHPIAISGPDQRVTIPSLALDLPLSDIYRGVL